MLDEICQNEEPAKTLVRFEFHRVSYEPVREKTNNLGFRPSPTQTSLYIL